MVNYIFTNVGIMFIDITQDSRQIMHFKSFNFYLIGKKLTSVYLFITEFKMKLFFVQIRVRCQLVVESE